MIEADRKAVETLGKRVVLMIVHGHIVDRRLKRSDNMTTREEHPS